MADFQRSKQFRSGLTLIELLIVSAVLLILASLSLTAMKGLLRGQKVGQAATTVKQYLQNAQVRALASGRPVAVFMDRVNMTGNGGNPIQQNFTVTRLQFGEVFPPYVGDTADAVGTLESVPYSDTNLFSPQPTARLIESPPGSNIFIDDAYADMIRIPLDRVSAAFGNGDPNTSLGFVRPGDFIEVEGSRGRFVIETFLPVPTNNPTHVEVRFFNPPPTYTAVRQAKIRNGTALHPIYETADHAPVEPQPLVIGSANVKFKIYRQPTRSLVGSIVLPRGTCIDLSVSGVGITDSAVDGGQLRRRGIIADTVGRSEFSRLGLVFNSEGRLSYILDEDSWRDDMSIIPASTRMPARIALNADSLVYLMVGRTDQVLPGFNGTNGKLATLQHPDVDTYTVSSQSELPKANLMDPENVWITCNPFTGEIRSAPVAPLQPLDVNNRAAAVQGDPNTLVGDLILQARAMAASGLSN